MNERLCIGCQVEIPNSRSKQARYCTNICGNRYRNRKHYQAHPDHFAQQRLESNSRIRTRIIQRVKSRAKRGGIPFNLVKEDIVIPEACPVLGISLDGRAGKGQGFHPHSPSVDRIDPQGGYLKGNIRIISNRANLLKSNATLAEMEAVVADLRRIQNG